MPTLHTNYGAITIELDFEKTPKSVANFLEYVRSGYYDGTIFHRVINGFMVQCGGFDPGMKQKATRTSIKNEADCGGKNRRGSIAYARTSDPHSATAQFFINVVDNAFLDHTSKSETGWGYCVFGQVVDGMEVVDKIKSVSTTSVAGHQDVPIEDVVIEKIVVEELETV